MWNMSVFNKFSNSAKTERAAGSEIAKAHRNSLIQSFTVTKSEYKHTDTKSEYKHLRSSIRIEKIDHEQDEIYAPLETFDDIDAI